jgi:hypothetical protein
MPFSCSKIGLKQLFEIYLKIEIVKNSFQLTGPRASHPAHWPKLPGLLGSASFPLARSWMRHARLPRLPGRHAATVHWQRGAVAVPAGRAAFKF